MSYPPPVLMEWDHVAQKYVEAREDICAARWASPVAGRVSGDICGRDAPFYVGDTPVCSHHHERAEQWSRTHPVDCLDERLGKVLAKEDEIRQANKRLAAALADRSVVYYLERESDRMIKIGTTTHAAARFKAHRKEHSTLSLLLTHPGSYTEETELHRRFKAHQVAREWFRAEKPLADWILAQRLDEANADQMSEVVSLKYVQGLARTAGWAAARAEREARKAAKKISAA